MRFKTRPCEIEAIEYTGKQDNLAEILLFTGWTEVVEHFGGGIDIQTLEGTMLASKGDWIVKGREGEFYPVKPSIFQRKYKAIDGPDSWEPRGESP